MEAVERIFKASMKERKECFEQLSKGTAEIQSYHKCPLCGMPILLTPHDKETVCIECLSPLIKIDEMWFPKSMIG